MIRTFHLADLFTLANAFSGMGDVLLAMRAVDHPGPVPILIACAFLPASFIFDALDGRIARWRQKISPLGRELDSLADLISFAVAPAAIGFAAGLRGRWDCMILTVFVGCAVSRLARFNVTAEALSAGKDRVAYFEGTPTPVNMVLVMVLAIAAWQGRLGNGLYWGKLRFLSGDWHPLSLLFAVMGALMISSIRIPKP